MEEPPKVQMFFAQYPGSLGSCAQHTTASKNTKHLKHKPGEGAATAWGRADLPAREGVCTFAYKHLHKWGGRSLSSSWAFPCAQVLKN